MEQMFLSASIISCWADWESGIGVTCWHEQSSDLSARRCAGAAAAIPARQGAGTCTASLDYSQINTWKKLLRPTGGVQQKTYGQQQVRGYPSPENYRALHIRCSAPLRQLQTSSYFIGMTWESNQHQTKHRSPEICHSSKKLLCPQSCFAKIKHCVRCDARNLCLFITDRHVERENLFLW